MIVGVGEGCHLSQGFLLVPGQAAKGSSRLVGDADFLLALKVMFCFTGTENLSYKLFN